MSVADPRGATSSAYECHILHAAGAITVPAGARERPLMTALGGLIAVNAGMQPAHDSVRGHPYVAVINAGPGPLPYAQQLDGALTRGSLAPGRTMFTLACAGGEMTVLQIQIGPVPGATTATGDARSDDVLTLVLSAEESAAGAGSFIGQGIGGRAG